MLALAVTFSYQTLASLASVAPSVMTPEAAKSLGVAPTAIGVFIAITYSVAMSAGLAGGAWSVRFGPLRLIQISLLLMAAGLVCGASGWIIGAIVFALLIGAGYGFINPATSSILAKKTPPGQAGLMFSIKQSGVPAGSMLAGLVVPSLLLAVGWQVTLVVIAIACAVLALAIQPTRSDYDREAIARAAAPRPPARRESLARPIRMVRSNARLQQLAWMSLIYSGTQGVLFAHLVSYLNLEIGYGLVAAGLAFSAVGAAGIAGRILWGVVADHWVRPRIMLGTLGMLMGACSLATASIASDWPFAIVITIGILFGLTAVSWNGIFFAEVARLAPNGEIGAATAGAQFFSYAGAMSGPALFGLLVSMVGSYAIGFVALAAFPLGIGLAALLHDPNVRQDREA